MPRSKHLSPHKHLITQNELVKLLADKTLISEPSVRRLLQALPEVILEQHLLGNTVRVHNLCTFHLRRRDYTQSRRDTFHMAPKATLPEFCYYPYANFSVPFRQKIADAKFRIASNLAPLEDTQ